MQARTAAPFGVNLRADAPDAAERVEMIIAERVPVASFALAPRPGLIAALRDAGVVTIASVGARRHAEKVAAWGIDAVIATGGEGGGHTGAVPTSLLIPQVVDAVDIPVVAAGGFFDGRGLAAALAYGAAGIAMGTRFLLTSDSPVADVVKQAYLASDVTGHGGHHPGRRGPAPGAAHAAGGAPGPGRAGHRAAAVGPQRGRVPQPVRAQLAGPDPPGPRDAPGHGTDLGSGADGREHPDAAAGGDGGRPARPGPDVGRAGGRADRGPAVLRGPDRSDHDRGRSSAWPRWAPLTDAR